MKRDLLPLGGAGAGATTLVGGLDLCDGALSGSDASAKHEAGNQTPIIEDGDSSTLVVHVAIHQGRHFVEHDPEPFLHGILDAKADRREESIKGNGAAQILQRQSVVLQEAEDEHTHGANHVPRPCRDAGVFAHAALKERGQREENTLDKGNVCEHKLQIIYTDVTLEFELAQTVREVTPFAANAVLLHVIEHTNQQNIEVGSERRSVLAEQDRAAGGARLLLQIG